MKINRHAIIAIPNPLLRKKSTKIKKIDQNVKRLVTEMVSATLDWEDHRKHEFGAALAAVQIARPYRVVVIRSDFEDKKGRKFDAYINPEIIETSGEPEEELEGCLSVKDVYGSVKRYPTVKVRAQTLDGKEVKLTAHGFLARVFQHEIDHTNGLVFLDRINDPTKLFKITAEGKFVSLKTQP
jgi:peptide deformylase